MGTVDTVVLLAALFGLLLLPCVVAGLICADELLDRVVWAVAQRRELRRERRLLGDLERILDAVVADQRGVAEAFAHLEQPPIQQIAADLRRLNRLRLGVATRSPVWHAAILQAYDERLRLACAGLRVTEHLGDLGGVDLEIERLRVEGELTCQGLALDGTRRGQAA